MISLNGVSASYPDKTKALHNITLTIKPGVKIAVLGVSGSGKSTLFHLLTGLMKPENGILKWGETVLVHKKKPLQEWRKKIGFVMQNPDMQLFAPTVEEDVIYGPLQQGMAFTEAKQAAEAAMEACGIFHLRHKPPHFLSMGEKKRAAIAGVAAMNPDVLILDEPEAGLDPANTNKLIALMNDFHKRGKTIISSTHHVDFAYEWAEEYIVLEKGHLVCHDSPSVVFKQTLPPGLELPWAFEIGQLTGTTPSSRKEAIQILRERMANN